jgi:DtxR family Mn-dependent transcriptional regulator
LSHRSDLIDTTEMYLRTVYELEEEGVVPLRARIAERLGQSGPTVSQTVARMERDGLLTLAGDRHLHLTELGTREATAVMRKHRLAERLLADVIGLDWEDLHIEACRWEHVMSDEVERRIVALLKAPFVCPHGNPIPGLEQLGVHTAAGADAPAARPVAPAGTDPGPTATDGAALLSLGDSVAAGRTDVVVDRISELLQPDAAVMHRIKAAGMQPGGALHVAPADDGIEVWADGAKHTVFEARITDHVFVRAS